MSKASTRGYGSPEEAKVYDIGLLSVDNDTEVLSAENDTEGLLSC